MFSSTRTRKPLRTSTKRAVYQKASGKCARCGMPIRWGSRKGTYHHTRTPSVRSTAKTVQFLCQNCHSEAHEYKTVRRSGLFETKKVVKIVRKRLRKKSSPIKRKRTFSTTKRRATTARARSKTRRSKRKGSRS